MKIKNKQELKTPCYIIQKSKIIENLEKLKEIIDTTGCKILLAQKAFSMYSLYPLIGKYLSGTAASGLYEAKLGKEEMGKENHVFSPAYKEDEIDEIINICDHIIFNSPAQLEKYKERVLNKGKSIGLRINPECSTQKGHEIYDPCRSGSRLGTKSSQITEKILENVAGLHFHTLCEQNSDDLEITLKAVEEKFGKYLYKMKWINFGGGHHITRYDYDIKTLKKCIRHIQEKYGITVYLEPGEAIALNAGILLSEVLEIVENDILIGIIDASAACHMPDVLEMPYRPHIKDSSYPQNKPYTYQLAGATCLAGDIIGEYSFNSPLKIGQKLEFQDMAIYTMVKNNTFNGMKLPDIVLEENGEYEIIRSFGYNDFKSRL
ncbi:MAG: carboxynorspermidine decarboxylase [Candidatus Gastranaerophilales bacterium]|nr:carboxynorspermidine decarboxylase [Candidatus Gastranaerophilales bacterium]